MEEKQVIALEIESNRSALPVARNAATSSLRLHKTGKITRVSCPNCGSRVPYKVGAGRGAVSNGSGAPYDRSRTYRRGQTMMHPTFGEGEVTAIVEPGKMDVLFADRIRRLIHARI